MYIAFGKHEIEVKATQDVSEFERLLTVCDSSLTLQSRFEAVNYHICVVHRGRSELRNQGRLGIGVVCAAFGLPPVVLTAPDLDRILIGYDMDLVGIDVGNARLVFSMHLEAPFYAMYRSLSHSMILVFHEIGVRAVTLDGILQWGFVRDIVTGTQLTEDSISLRFMDAQPVTLDLATGAAVSVGET